MCVCVCTVCMLRCHRCDVVCCQLLLCFSVLLPYPDDLHALCFIKNKRILKIRATTLVLFISWFVFILFVVCFFFFFFICISISVRSFRAFSQQLKFLCCFPHVVLLFDRLANFTEVFVGVFWIPYYLFSLLKMSMLVDGIVVVVCCGLFIKLLTLFNSFSFGWHHAI